MENNYSEGYIVFMDILGFSKIIESNNSVGTIKEIFEFANKIMYLFNTSDISGVKITFFSDSFVLTTNTTSIQSFQMIMEACHLINTTIYNKIKLFTRGAITCGKFYHENSIAFGPGIIEAYRMEENDAKYIRMVVSDSAMKQLVNSNEKDAFIQKSDDGLWYYNWYMLALTDAHAPDKFNVNQAKIIMARNKKIIVDMLDKYNGEKVYEKYLWMKTPFNECCKIMNNIFKEKIFEEFIISNENI